MFDDVLRNLSLGPLGPIWAQQALSPNQKYHLQLIFFETFQYFSDFFTESLKIISSINMCLVPCYGIWLARDKKNWKPDPIEWEPLLGIQNMGNTC